MSLAAIPINPEREKQLAERRKGVGSSDVAALFPEDSKYGCTRELVFDKRGVKPDFERTEGEQAVLEKGNELEPVIAEKFSRDYGFKVRRQPVTVDPSEPTRRVSMDYQIVKATTDQITGVWPKLVIQGECGPGVLECKTTNLFDYAKMVKEGIIPDYVFQMERLLQVTGYKWGVFAVLEPDFWKMLVFPFTPHADLIVEMDKRARAFWTLIEDPTLPLPPALPSGDARCGSCLWRKTCRGQQYLHEYHPQKASEYTEDDSFSEVLSDLKHVRNQIDALQETETNIEKNVKEEMTAKKLVKLSVPAVDAKVIWQDQDGANKWDTKALEAEAGTIGRKVAFADYVQGQHPELVIDFQKKFPKSESIEDKFKFRAAPTKPFKVTFKE